MTKLATFTCSVMMMTVIGCGGPEVTSVTGSIIYNDQPLDRVTINLWPNDEPEHGILVCPENQADGSFTITPDPEWGQKGIVGTYKVIVCESTFADAMAMIATPPRFPTKYWRDETSPLVVEINKGVTDLGEIVLEPDPEELVRWHKAFKRLIEAKSKEAAQR